MTANPDNAARRDARALGPLADDLLTAALGRPNRADYRDGVMDMLNAITSALGGAGEREALDDRPHISGAPVCKIAAYNDAHEDAVGMGYPSLTEALEHLSELREVAALSPAPEQGS